jgi:hypothetical protein
MTVHLIKNATLFVIIVNTKIFEVARTGILGLAKIVSSCPIHKAQ